MGDRIERGKDPEEKSDASTGEEPRADPPAVPLKSPAGRSGGKVRFHSRYGDQTPVLEGQQPPRINGPDPVAQGPHTVLRYDPINKRITRDGSLIWLAIPFETWILRIPHILVARLVQDTQDRHISTAI
jgi:hypothetical protein